MSHYYDKNIKCDVCGEYFDIWGIDSEINNVLKEKENLQIINKKIPNLEYTSTICKDCSDKIAKELKYHRA